MGLECATEYIGLKDIPLVVYESIMSGRDVHDWVRDRKYVVWVFSGIEKLDI